MIINIINIENYRDIIWKKIIGFKIVTKKALFIFLVFLRNKPHHIILVYD